MFVCVDIQPGSRWINIHCRFTWTFHCIVLTHTHGSTLPTVIQSLSPSSAFLPSCLDALFSNSMAVTQSISRLGAQCRGRRAGSQSGGVVEGSEVDACVRETLSHIPPVAGSRPGLRRGFASFSRPLRFLRSSGSYSFPARKQPSSATAGRGGTREWGGEERKQNSLASKWVQGSVQQAVGLNHKAHACLGYNQRQPRWQAERARVREQDCPWERGREWTIW